MSNEEIVSAITSGDTYLGIEFGSTRIKAVMVLQGAKVIATGIFDWENQLVDGIWTYPMSEVWDGLASCYANLQENVKEQYGVEITKIKSIGVSAMMHGYLPFDKNGNQLCEFRTWRNNNTAVAASKLTELFSYNIPMRWSISHLFHAILEKEDHVKDIDFITTLAGYVHWKLSGQKVLGIGDASGMFPVLSTTKQYNKEMLDKFSTLVKSENFAWNIKDILPEIKLAGQSAGTLTKEGALLLDKSGKLEAGSMLCPPEGDAGTGMVATNSILPKTGNISCGTSAFAMIVLDKELKSVHRELDMVNTPAGDLVAMSHANNCTTEINAWIKLFKEFCEVMGLDVSTGEIFIKLFENSLNADKDCDGLVPFGFHSGEDIVGLEQGCPMLIHPTKSNFNLANFIRSQIYTSFAAMKLGIDILVNEENAEIESLIGHGGIFTTPKVAQTYLSAALGTKIKVMNTASEGGAWGIALLARFADVCSGETISLVDFLNDVFANNDFVEIEASNEDKEGYAKFIENYKEALNVEKKAVSQLSKGE